MSSTKGSRSRHANNAELLIRGVLVGELININVRESGGVSPVHVTGTAYPVEHTYDRYSCSVTASRVVFKDGALADLELNNSELIAQEPMEIVATDTSDGGGLFKITTATLSDRSIGINANTRLSSDLSWQGICVPTTAQAL